MADLVSDAKTFAKFLERLLIFTLPRVVCLIIAEYEWLPLFEDLSVFDESSQIVVVQTYTYLSNRETAANQPWGTGLWRRIKKKVERSNLRLIPYQTFIHFLEWHGRWTKGFSVHHYVWDPVSKIPTTNLYCLCCGYLRSTMDCCTFQARMTKISKRLHARLLEWEMGVATQPKYQKITFELQACVLGRAPKN